MTTRLVGATPYSAHLHGVKCMPGFVRQFGAAVSTRSHRSLLLQGVAKLTFMAGIAAGILFAWQGITLQVQKFSVRQDSFAPVQAVAHWVQHAWTAAVQRVEAPLPNSSFAQEKQMSSHQLIDRWMPAITAASVRYSVPASWIRAVVQMESGGRTMIGEDKPIVSPAGAMGLMQLMPGTYKLMSAQFHLGADPFNPRDNIAAGAAYLHQLYQHYGFPAMFAAYNDGPGHLEERLQRGRLLPLETRNYVNRIVTALNGGTAQVPAALQKSASTSFTRPNGQPVAIRLADITAVRMPLAGEYPAGVKAVITIGRVSQGVREDYQTVKADMLEHGALGQPVSGAANHFSALLAANLVRAAHPVRTASNPRTGGGRHVAVSHGRIHATLRLANSPPGGGHVAASHGRVHATLRLADSEAIHLHPVRHGRS